MEVTTKCVQLHLVVMVTSKYDVERMMRDAKIAKRSAKEQVKFSVWLFLVHYLSKEENNRGRYVCIKQVPDTAGGVKVQSDGTLDRAAMLTIMNPDDKASLRGCFKIKRPVWRRSYCFNNGTSKSWRYITRSISNGADNAVLVTDRCLGGADTWATSSTITAAMKWMGDYDLIVTGRQASMVILHRLDRRSPWHLDIPVISYARKIEIEGDAVKYSVSMMTDIM